MTVTAPPKVVVIGGGPAGLVAAASFAAAGYHVEVHEKRPGPPDPSADHRHSFTVVLNPKGIDAITSVGSPTVDRSLPLHACMRHSADGRWHQAFLEPKPGMVMAVERSELTQSLYQAVLRNHPKTVKFFFDSYCKGLDLGRKQVLVGPQPSQLEDSVSSSSTSSISSREEDTGIDVSGQRSTAKGAVISGAVSYDLLVAADGANSEVRRHLGALLPGQFVFNRRLAPMVYKRFRELPCPDDFTGKYGPGGSVLHFYGAKLPKVKAETAIMMKSLPEASNMQQPAGTAAPPAAAASQASAGVPISGAPFITSRTSSAATADGAASADCEDAPSRAARSGTREKEHRDLKDAPTSAAAGTKRPASAKPPAAPPSGPRGWGFLSLINCADGTCSGGLSISSHDQERMQNEEDYEVTLQSLPFPPSTLRNLVRQLAAASWTWAGAWVRCSRLHGPGVVVIGDAAHAVSPSLGQGCNAALEDVTVLQQILRELLLQGAPGPAGGDARRPPTSGLGIKGPAAAPVTTSFPATAAAAADAAIVTTSSPAAAATNVSTSPAAAATADFSISPAAPAAAHVSISSAAAQGCTSSPSLLAAALEELPEAFTARRLPDVHALVWLDENARAFRGQMGVFNTCFVMYLAHMYFRGALHRAMPRLVAKPKLQEVWESSIPYTVIVKQLKRDGAVLILSGATVAAAGVAALALAVLVPRKRCLCR